MNTLRNIEFNKIENLKNLVPYGDNTINSLMIALNNNLNMAIFSFDKNEMLSEHSAPADAFVYILEGSLEISINKINYTVNKNETILMPANILHGLKALEKTKMLLIIIKKSGDEGGFTNIDYSKVQKVTDLVTGFKGGVVSKRIANLKDTTSLIFAISNNEEIEHNQTEGELFICNFQGELSIKINEQENLLKENEIITISPNTLYELKSISESKFLMLEFIKNYQN